MNMRLWNQIIETIYGDDTPSTLQCVFVAIILFVFALVVLVVILFISRWMNLTTTNPESVVIAFFGIIATFIVIGNYAQVSNIEQRFSSQVNELKEQIGKRPTKDMVIDDILKDKRMLKIFSVDEKFEKMKELCVSLSSHKLSSLLARVLTGESVECTVKISGAKDSQKATAKLKDYRLIFIDKDSRTINDVVEVSGCKYDEDSIKKIIFLYNSIDESKLLSVLYG